MNFIQQRNQLNALVDELQTSDDPVRLIVQENARLAARVAELEAEIRASRMLLDVNGRELHEQYPCYQITEHLRAYRTARQNTAALPSEAASRAAMECGVTYTKQFDGTTGESEVSSVRAARAAMEGGSK